MPKFPLNNFFLYMATVLVLTTKCLHVNRVSVNCITKHGALKQVDNFLANVKIECHFYQISFSEK